MLRREGARPSRPEIERAALALIPRHGAQILAAARRHSATPEDAEDAYQRALEILLTKAPSTSEDDLVPWLKTVVKHEAWALRRQRERHTPPTDDGELRAGASADAATHERAERFERLRQGAEALERLKPQEVRALRLKAEGYSYREICRITGWTYTKVNRCLTEGRKALLDRLRGIESGGECERLAPLLSLLADGEAGSRELSELRPHLKTCLACRARLREYRDAPARVAALLPVAALTGQSHGLRIAPLAESLLGAVQQKAERLHAALELASGKKAAAVAASAAALTGGGVGVERMATDPHSGPSTSLRADEPSKPQPAVSPPTRAPTSRRDEQTRPAPQPARPTAPAQPPPARPDPAAEFAPAATPASEAHPSSSAASGGTTSGSGEFGP
ncbi:MAG: sigma-70 family RNA polymerase sigma factor [Thermoleophilaceae bacterium]